MGWDIDVKEKIYLRLANEIFFRIYNGTYQLGSKLPSYIKPGAAQKRLERRSGNCNSMA